MIVKSVKTFKNKIIFNRKGDIIKFINKNDKIFKGFGEVYFSEIKKNNLKGWNVHKKNNCLICVPFGSVNFKIFNHVTHKLFSIKINKKNNKILFIPPKNWFSFTSTAKISLIANLIDNVHSKTETVKLKNLTEIKKFKFK